MRQLPEQSGENATEDNRVSVGEAVQWAEDHLFDRNSVVLECQLWQQALERARGENFSVAELKEFTRQRDYIRNPNASERSDVARSSVARMGNCSNRQGRRRATAIHWWKIPTRRIQNWMTNNARLWTRLLRSTNAVSLFRGGAGTGKSFVLRELVEQIRQSGRRVVVLAPQRQQVVDMEKAGFPSPTTVANFLLKRELAEGAVVVVDEAGQIGGRQMLELLRLARERNARVILSGDTRQHGAVEASDALLAIERHSGIKPVELHTIRRQDPALGRDEKERTQHQAVSQGR